MSQIKKYPFKFLDAYSKDDTGIFFGRDEEINALYEMVFQTSILLIYGASGTGKTSLVQCGLAGKFQSHDWLALTVRRGKNINTAFEKVLADAGGTTTPGLDDMDWLNDIMSEKEVVTKTARLSLLAQSFKAIYLNSFKPVYLIFDQFEELFILGSKEEQEQFIDTVQEILKMEQPVKMIFCIREEYLGYLYEFEAAVPQLLRKKLRVEPMNLDKVRQVIVGATSYENSNVKLKAGETDLISKGIFDKIKGKEKTLTIQLPYLQVFLDKFYLEITNDESRQAEATFTIQSLNDIGDIGDVLRNFLEEQVVSISRKLIEEYPGILVTTIWKILSPFATLEGTKEPISKQGLYERLPDLSPMLINATVEAFISSRILRYIEDADLYEIAHDSLAKRIAEKRSDEEIALLEIKRLIKSQNALKADARELFTEKQLNFIEPFLKKIQLTADEKALIDQSYEAVEKHKALEKSEREAENQRLLERQKLLEKNQRSQKRFIRWISVACVIMIGLAIWAYGQKRYAEQAKKTALAAEHSAKLAIAKDDKLINAFYFYDEKFALAIKKIFGVEKYGFINKEGDIVIDYKYAKAEQFDYAGFAKVKKNENNSMIDYLVDTAGNEYKAAFKIEDLKNDITALYLDGQKLTGFPGEILKNTQLQVLLLPDNFIKNLPAGIQQLKNLQALDLSRNLLTALPSEIGKLSTLQKLYLHSNKLNVLPTQIWQLDNLQELYLGSNKLTTLPSEIGQLKNLRALDLSSNQLTTLPLETGQLQNLQILDLSKNSLKAIPAEIGQLRNLRALDLVSNQLTVFPSQIQQLKNLFMLDLGSNHLEILPAGIGQLKTLQELYLGDNQLALVPAEIGELENLQKLDLGSNSLKDLPTEIGKLGALVKLYLNSNKLALLSFKIEQLKSLELLDLSSNQLTALPPDIGKLKTLHELYITSNKLTALPPEIGQLEALQELHLYSNPLAVLPSEIGQLENLQILDLSRDSLKSLPSEIGQLKNLRTLDLSSNYQLKVLPPQIGQLRLLRKLHLINDTISKSDLQQIHSALPGCQIFQ